MKKEEAIELSEEDLRVEAELKVLLQLPDLPLEQIFDIEELTELQNKINEFFEENKDYTYDKINASNFFSFKEALYSSLSKDESFTDSDKKSMDDYLSSIFPSYQDINSWLKSYYNEGHNEEINQLIDDLLLGGQLKFANGFVKNDTLVQSFNKMGVSAEDTAKKFIALKNSILAEKAAADKAKSQEIKIDFNTKKNTFDTEANSTLSMFEAAISSAQSAFSNQATVTYEDMWTMIQTDESLVNSFTKTANGYTISVDALREAKERYIATQKREFEITRRNALQQIEDSKKAIEEAEKIIRGHSTNEEKANARKTIQEENKIISEQEIVLAKVDLQLEEINSQTVDYANTLDEITSKLSSWKSIYQSIINDMSKINKLSSSTLQAIIKAAPNNWQDMVYLDDNKQIQADQQKLFEFANQDLISNVKDQQDKLNKVFSELVNSTFKSKYNLDLGVDFKLTDDYEKNLEIASKEIQNAIGRAMPSQHLSVKGSVKVNETLEELTPNLDEATEGVKIFIAVLEALFGEFEENKALADFNSGIEEIQHSLSMGSINQSQYNSAYAGKVSEFKNAVYANGSIDDPEVQDQLNQMYETIHSNQQNELSKQLEKEKQSIQDAYDQRLITAEQYYTQLAEIEDRYYGTKDSRGLLDDPDGTNIEEKIREQIERRKQLYEDQKAILQDNYDKSLINFDTFEKDLHQLETYWLKNVPELKITFDEETYNNVDILYESELAEIEKLSEQHISTDTQTAAEMRRIWEKYYKDKEGFAKQSYEAEKRYLEAAKNDVQTQINGIQALIDINEENINAQIKILEEQNDKITKAYDDQISLIDKQIDAIDEQINAIKDKADEEDRYYKIQKAEEELKKSSQLTRRVYRSDGLIEYRPDAEKQREALKNYNDAKRDLVISDMEKEKDAKEKEKDALEEAKEVALKDNNDKIDALNTTLAELNNPLEDLVTILSANLAETYGLDPEVIQELLKTDASKLALEQMNKAREAQGEKTTTAEDLTEVGEKASEAYHNQTVSQTTKDEQIKDANKNVTDPQKTNNNSNYEVIDTILVNKDSDKLSYNSDKIVKLAALLSSGLTDVSTLSSLGTMANSKLNGTINPDTSMFSNNTTNDNSAINTFSGDIIIQEPVGNSYDLAQELRMNLPNAFEKQMYSNLKKY